MLKKQSTKIKYPFIYNESSYESCESITYVRLPNSMLMSPRLVSLGLPQRAVLSPIPITLQSIYDTPLFKSVQLQNNSVC